MMGCASIVSDSQYPVTFDSKPAGAEIEISNRHGEVVPDRFEVEMPVTSAGAAEPQLRIIDISEIDAAQRGTLIAVH